MTSIAAAKERFQYLVLPRRIRDETAENAHFMKYGVAKVIYRRVEKYESERGELVPLFGNYLESFSEFGIGIGIYFVQIFLYIVICLMCALILIPALQAFYSSSYSDNTSGDPMIMLSGACSAAINVTATSGCTFNTTCNALFRENCEIPQTVIVADLAMCGVFFLCTFLAGFVEGKLSEELDEAIQTAQDYSVIVDNPPPDALDIDEWYSFFCKFGKVRYVSFSRANNRLIQLLQQKHALLRNATTFVSKFPLSMEGFHQDLERAQCDLQFADSWVLKAVEECKRFETAGITNLVEHNCAHWTESLISVSAGIDACLKEAIFPVSKVFVTFEHEEAQRHCIEALEVPGLAVLSKDFYIGKEGYLFRHQYVLEVNEPSEPDNIIWSNLEISDNERYVRRFISISLSLLVLVACKLFVELFEHLKTWTFLSITMTSATNEAFAIGILDSLLPPIFTVITSVELATDNDDVQDSLLTKLIAARLLTSVLFPHLKLAWGVMLDAATIQSISNIQIAACITAPLLTLLDAPGVILRNVVGPLSSNTQKSLNSYWMGNSWLLAERYTGLAKIIFVSLFYSLITPLSMAVATFACVILFWIDRYMLLRSWQPVPMLDSSMGARFRSQCYIAIAAHMYMSSRFIYGWPFDQVHRTGVDTFEKVNKDPSYLVIYDSKSQVWHSASQQLLYRPYMICSLIVIILCTWQIFGARIVQFFQTLCTSVLSYSGQAMGIPYSTLDKIAAYCPVCSSFVASPELGEETLITADVTKMLPSQLHLIVPEDKVDICCLCHLIPSLSWKSCLGVVKYYDDGAEKSYTKNFQIPHRELPPRSDLLSTLMPPVDGVLANTAHSTTNTYADVNSSKPSKHSSVYDRLFQQGRSMREVLYDQIEVDGVELSNIGTATAEPITLRSSLSTMMIRNNSSSNKKIAPL